MYEVLLLVARLSTEAAEYFLRVTHKCIHNAQFSGHVNARSVHSIFAGHVNTSIALKGLRNFKTATWINIQIAMNTLQYVQSRN